MIVEQTPCFKFKASFSPCTILKMNRYDLHDFKKQLMNEIAKAPQFFKGTPVVIDLEKVKSLGILDFAELKEILINSGLVPVGVRAGSEAQLEAAFQEGLPQVNVGKNAEPEKSKNKKEDICPTSKVITDPIRSGMQIYAKEGDLVIIGPVSSGAEILADGNIHVYGPLRGRALAGVKGNIHARIFCRILEAELISIAGYYLTKEEISPPAAQQTMIQLYLENEQIHLQAI